MRIPISTKLITVTILILVASTTTITLISTNFFEKKAAEQVDISNLESAVGTAKEVNNILSTYIEKTRNLGTVFLNNSSQIPVEADLLPFFKDKNFVSIELLKLHGNSTELLARKVKEDSLKPYNLTASYISTLRTQQKFPLGQLVLGNIEIKNSSLPRAPALITLGVPLVKDHQGRITHVVLADISMAPLEKPFTNPSEHTQYLIDRTGEILAHKDEQKAIARINMSKDTFVQKALAQDSPQFQTKYKDPDTDVKYFGAAVTTAYGATLISQTSEQTILEVSDEVKRRSIFVAGSAISLAIFFYFSIFNVFDLTH